MSNRNFYAKKTAEAVLGAQNFSDLISSAPTTYGLVAGQSTAFAALNTALQAAWTESETPATRTAVAIEARRIALANMRDSAKALNAVIRATASVTDAMLMDLGLLPRTSPSPIPATMTAPEVDVVDIVGRVAKLRIRQAGGVESDARPDGSAGAYVYSFVGATAPVDPSEYKFEGLATRVKDVEVLFPDSVASGATAWIAAAWVSQRGQRGFACTPVQVTIQGGPVLAGEAA